MAAEPLEVRIARLEGAYEQVDRRLGSIEDRLGRIEARIDSAVADLRREISTSFWRLAILLLGSWITLIIAILRR